MRAEHEKQQQQHIANPPRLQLPSTSKRQELFQQVNLPPKSIGVVQQQQVGYKLEISNCQQFSDRSVSVDNTDEDIASFWSDSPTSNCDNSTNCSNGQLNNKIDQQNNHKSGSRRCNTKVNSRPNGGRNVRKRVMANERERERTKSLNQALEILRNRLPVPEAEKRSKIQTLRMAKEYIEFLAKFKLVSTNQNQIEPTSTLINQQQDSILNRQYNNNNIKTEYLQTNHPTTTTIHQPEVSSLTYKFYKFRLKSQNRNE